MNNRDSNIFWDRISERANETILALKKGEQPPIIRYAIHITSCCNMRCKYCRENHIPKTMSREFFKSICKKAGYEGIVHITGGEPLLVSWLEDEIIAHRYKTRMALNSNLLIRPRILTLLSIFRLKTSLDDFNENRWNKITGGDFFKKVISNIKYASEIVKYTSVCFTATHQNANRLETFVKFCKKEFPNLFSLSVSFYKGEDKDFILTAQDIKILFNASKNMDKISRQLFIETHSKQGNYYPENIKISCYLSMSERLYDENENEYFCSHLYRDKVSPPGNPGKDLRCINGCNARFNKFNQLIHQELFG